MYYYKHNVLCVCSVYVHVGVCLCVYVCHAFTAHIGCILLITGNFEITDNTLITQASVIEMLCSGLMAHVLVLGLYKLTI